LSERVADLLRPEIDALSRPSPWAGVAAWWAHAANGRTIGVGRYL